MKRERKPISSELGKWKIIEIVEEKTVTLQGLTDGECGSFESIFTQVVSCERSNKLVKLDVVEKFSSDIKKCETINAKNAQWKVVVQSVNTCCIEALKDYELLHRNETKRLNKCNADEFKRKWMKVKINKKKNSFRKKRE